MLRTTLFLAVLLSASGLLMADASLKGSALLLLAVITTVILRRDSAATRHLIWMLAIVAMLVLPFLSATLPQWRVLPDWASLASRNPATTATGPVVSVPVVNGIETNSTPISIDAGTTPVMDDQHVNAVVKQPAAATPQFHPPSTAASSAWIPVVSIIWGLGCCGLVLRLLAARMLLWNSERHSTVIALTAQAAGVADRLAVAVEAACLHLGIRHSITLLVHADKSIPVVWGLWRHRLLLPAAARDWSDEQLRSVLLHELAHIKRRDVAVQLMSQVACALHWFNPLVWFADWRISVERERACDDLVLASGVRPSIYAGHLLQVVTDLSPARWTQSCGLAMARRSSIESRLVAVLSGNLNRRGVSVALAVLAGLVGIGIAVPIAMLRAADSKPKEAIGPAASAVKPKQIDDQKLYAEWRANSRVNGNIPGGRLVPLARVLANFVEMHPKHDKAAALATLLKRINPSRDWKPADAATLLDDLTAIDPEWRHWMEFEVRESPSGPIRVRKSPPAGSPIKVRKPLPAELANVAWGPPVKNGLRAGWRRDPSKNQYPLGTALKASVVIQNTGTQTIVFRTPEWHQGGNPSAHDANGDDITVTAGETMTLIQPVTLRLAPGESADLEGHGIAIGTLSPDDPAWEKLRIGAEIEANAGDQVVFQPADVVASEEQWTPDRRTVAEMWQAIVRVRIDLDRPLPSGAADREALVRRVILDLIGVPATPEEIKTFVADNSPDPLAALGQRLIPRVTPFDGKLPAGELKFRVTEAEPNTAKRQGNAGGADNQKAPPKDHPIKLDPGSAAGLKWGEAVNGLRAAVAFRYSSPQPKAGELPELYIAVQNISKGAIRLNDSLAETQPRMLYIKIDGRTVAGIGAKEPRLGDVTLLSNEVALVLMYAAEPMVDGHSIGSVMARDVLNDPHQTLVAHLQIEQAPAGAWTGKLVTSETSGSIAVGQPQPNDKEAQSLYRVWQQNARKNGSIPGGFIGQLRETIKRFIQLNATDIAGAPYAKKMEVLVPRFEASHDWTLADAVRLLNDIAAITSAPLSMALDEVNSITLVRGAPLPPELANAPWGQPQQSGLRLALMMEPVAKEYRLGTPLKSRLLIHNSGQNVVVFRTRMWHQPGLTATDAKDADITVNSVSHLTRGRFLPIRLWPGEFIELRSPGIGVGSMKNPVDWENAGIGSWIEAAVGDEVTVTAGPVPLHDWNETADPESRWWAELIKARLELELPFPADAEERKHLVYRAGMDCFGTPISSSEIEAFVTDTGPDALESLARRFAQHPRAIPAAGSLTSGTTTFRVLPPDPDAAKKPRTASNPGRYTLSGKAVLAVTRRPDGERIVNEASIQLSAPETARPYAIKLADGYNTWAAAWVRETGILWVRQQGIIRQYDFTDPQAVKELRLDEAQHLDQIPQPVLDALRSATMEPGASPQRGAPAASSAPAKPS
ncbi:MAG: DUF1549 domain-containing protein [Planctomycetes bacterium]|nr:DUF1549 domain-containing protein [Planctomycetota bacterium]